MIKYVQYDVITTATSYEEHIPIMDSYGLYHTYDQIIIIRASSDPEMNSHVKFDKSLTEYELNYFLIKSERYSVSFIPILTLHWFCTGAVGYIYKMHEPLRKFPGKPISVSSWRHQFPSDYCSQAASSVDRSWMGDHPRF